MFRFGILFSVWTIVASPWVLADLLIPDSLRDRVLRVSAVDGTVIDENFIVDAALSTPINVIGSGRGTLLMSDQILDEVREYSFTGQFLRTVISGGRLDNIRGIAVHNQRLYVTVASGSFANTVQSFDLNGDDQQTFIGSDLNSPWDVYFRNDDILVSNSGSDRIERFDLSGNYLSPFSNTTMTFPQQMNRTNFDGLLVGNFNDFIYHFDADGQLLETLGFGGVRGAYELENGNIIYTAGTRLAIYNRATGQSSDIFNNNTPGAFSNFRFIERVDFSAVPEPISGPILLLLSLAAFAGRKRRTC
jgi:hypothetical protein